MKQTLSIIGPTATGKTAFAWWLAKTLIAEKKSAGVDLISADSRQVYRELPIVSGADVPETLPAGVKIHGVGLIGVDEEWSVAHFRRYALPIVEASLEQGRLPVIVGGTGLYYRHLLNPALDQQPGPNEKLRAELQTKTVVELQEMLGQLNSSRLSGMNNSDRMNPRRLIRAIEQATSGFSLNQTQPTPVDRPVTLGLTDTLEHIETKIRARVEDRWRSGAITEVERLLSSADRTRPALSALGVADITDYLEGRLTDEQAKQAWALHELQYAKRQLTWWKKESTIRWFEVDQPDWQHDAYHYILTSLSF